MTTTTEKPKAAPAKDEIVRFPVARIKAESDKIIGRSRADTAGALFGLPDSRELSPEDAQAKVDKWLTKEIS